MGEEYFKFIQDYIEEEYGRKPLAEDTKLVDCELDSFALNMLFVSIASKYEYPDEEYSEVDWENITIGNIIDKIEIEIAKVNDK